MKRFILFVLSLLSITLNCDCTTTDKNIFEDDLLNTTSINGIIASQVPTNLVYVFKNCPLNDVLEKFFIDINGIYYQSAKEINAKYERRQNELNELVNEGILNNGKFRQNIDDDTTLIQEGLSDISKYLESAVRFSLKLVEKFEEDISKLTTNKVNTSTVKGAVQSIRQIMTKALQQIINSWSLMKNKITIAFAETDSSSVIFLSAAATLAEAKIAVENSVAAANQSEFTIRFGMQNDEHNLANIIFRAEQDVINVIQKICVQLTFNI